MLLAIRDRVMGVVGWIILVLLFITFAFFGLDSYLQSTAEDYAAKVNDVKISSSQQQRAYEQQVARLRQVLGDAYDPGRFDEATLKSTVLQKLINEELIQQTADSEGFTASDSLVAAQISAVEEFKQDGVFSKERYAQILRYQGMSPGEFEWRLNREIRANQLKAGIMLTAASPEDSLRRVYALQGQKRRFNYLIIPSTSVESAVEISDQDIERYYTDHPEQFMTPERVRVQYLELNAAELDVDATVTDDEIRELYEQQREQFVTPEQRHARHILITPEAESEQAIEAARAEAEQVMQRLEQGEDFAAVAAEVSDDTATASGGGDLGQFGRGIMVPEFEAAVFSMAVGERSGPVQSSFGFHVIELLEIMPEVATPLEDVREELIARLQEADRRELFYEQSETLSTLAFEQPDSLQGAADALGLPLHESGWITREGGDGIATHAGVVAAAFNDDVLKNGYNSTATEIDDDHLVVVRLLEHQHAAQQPLQDVREQAQAAVRAEKIHALLQQKGQQMLAELRAGNADLNALAGREGLEPGSTGLVQRSGAMPSREIVGRVFTLPAAGTDNPVYEGMHLPDGNYALLELLEVQPGEYDELPEAARKQAWRSLNEVYASGEMLMALDEMRAQADVLLPDNRSD